MFIFVRYRYVFDKLVRSKMIEKSIKIQDLTLAYKVLDDKNYMSELRKKLMEESQEVCECVEEKDEIMSEIADVYEVLDAICAKFNITKEEILKRQKLRKDERGDLLSREYVDYVEMDKDHDMAEYFRKYANKSNGRYPFFEVKEHTLSLLCENEGRSILSKRGKELKTIMLNDENFKTCIERFAKELGFKKYKIIGIATDEFDEKSKNSDTSFILQVLEIEQPENFVFERI